MPRIRTEQLLDRIVSGKFEKIILRAVSGGTFVMLLECDGEIFIHENANGEMKTYPKVENALRWLKRATRINKIVVDIAYWRLDD